jgi:PAS domain S-box-containing protein
LRKINELIQKFIEISSPDPDDQRRRRNLNIIILGMTLLLIIEIPISIFNLNNFEEQDNLFITIGSIFMLLSMIGIYRVNRTRQGSLSAYIFLGVIMLIISFSDTPAQLATGRSLFIFIIPIVMASLILQAGAAFIFAAIGSVIIAILAISIGQFPNTPAILSYFLVALLSWMASSSLEAALKDLRTVNADLDQIVIERTNELADALTRERIEAGRSQAILNSIADGVIVFDKQNVATLANPALSQLTEIPIQKLQGISLNDFVQEKNIPQSSQRSIVALIQNQKSEVTKISPRVEWGEKFLSTSVAQVQDPKTNEALGSVAVFRDITQETQLEKMKDNFVAIISHELRTPLNAIMGHAEILQEEVYGPLNEKQVSMTERVMVNVKRLLNMVGDLLNEAQIRAGKLTVKPEVIQTASLLENLHSSMDKIIADKGLGFVTRLGEDMPSELVGDPQRLQQILINLTGNALKFTEKGAITVSINRVGTDHWKMEVSDNGVGIPENEIPFIFETFRQANNLEFTTRQHGGIGLGLSIVKQLVELMNGEIKVTSEMGKGTTFTIVLPLTKEMKGA